MTVPTVNSIKKDEIDLSPDTLYLRGRPIAEVLDKRPLSH